MARVVRLLCLVFVVLALLPATAAANMASPTLPGDPVGEPAGDLSQLHVERESLAIDLRPLETGDDAAVEATYAIRNDGAEATVELVFVAAGLESDGSGVWLDGQPVDFKVPTRPVELPWSAPDTTPGLGGGTLPYAHQQDGQLLFALTMGTGRHDVTVRYAAAPSAYSGPSPVRFWQLAYVLAPAREWASFGTLDVGIQLPAGWSAASDPPLERTGDELGATFQGIPADSLAITAQAQVPAGRELWLFVALIVIVAIAVLIARAVGRRVERRKPGSLVLIPIAFAYGFVGAIGVVVAAMNTLGAQGIPVIQRAWTYGYTGTILALLSFPFVWIGLVVLMVIVGAVAARRLRSAARGVSNPDR